MTVAPWLSLDFLLLAQGGAQAAPGGGLMAMLPFMAVIFAVFYLMVLRPENKRRAETDRLRSDLKKNDRVLTIGGIYGTVVNAQQGSEEITIKVDESSNTKLRITRSAVQTVLTHKEGDDKSSASK